MSRRTKAPNPIARFAEAKAVDPKTTKETTPLESAARRRLHRQGLLPAEATASLILPLRFAIPFPLAPSFSPSFSAVPGRCPESGGPGVLTLLLLLNGLMRWPTGVPSLPAAEVRRPGSYAGSVLVRNCMDGRRSLLVLLVLPPTMAAAVVVTGVRLEVEGRWGCGEGRVMSPPALELGRRACLGMVLMYAELGVDVSVGKGLGSRAVEVRGGVSLVLLLIRRNKRCVFCPSVRAGEGDLRCRGGDVMLADVRPSVGLRVGERVA